MFWPASIGPCPRQELVETVIRPQIDEAGENIGEVGLRVDALELARFNQRSDASPVFGSVVVAGEESVLSCKGY